MKMPATLITVVGSVLKAVAQSKTVQTAREQILSRFWRWIKPSFIKEAPVITPQPDRPVTKEKCIVKGDINSVKRIVIGDEQPSSNEHYDRKCIVEGNISGANELMVGDRHNIYNNKA